MRLWLLAVFIVCCLVGTLSPADSVNIEKFVENAFVEIENEFTLDTSIELWNRILDNLYLMGRLWKVYNFYPQYEVSIKGSGFHIIDPTGIEGDVFELQKGNNNRIFLASGTLKKWFVPKNLRGRVLFLFNFPNSRNQVLVKLNIYGEEGSTIADKIMLKVISPVLRIYINRRIKRNINDFRTLLADIVNNPDKIRAQLSGRILDDFNLLVD
ncbi:MAG: hypothetical protein HOC71_02845 [Candidatus Latescibacteria bacterium]|nr:hypothetical protein [Candidatus Latescibacterota bacterium]